MRKKERERRGYIIDEHPSEHHISKRTTQVESYLVSSVSVEGFLYILWIQGRWVNREYVP